MLRRRLVALTLVLSSSFIGSVALLPASPASAKTVTVKAPWASPGNPIGTEVITLRGNIGRTIPRWARLERRTGGRWVFVRRTKLPRTGGYAFPVAMPAWAQSFRVVSAAVRGPRGRVWAKRISRVRTVYRAIQTANVAVPRQMRVGTAATIGLAFAPARPGRPAVLQANVNGAGWQTIANLAQDGAGRAAYGYVPPTNGTVEFRAVALASGGAPQLTGPALQGFALPTTRMKVAAHRGWSQEYPENTIMAYRRALETGADWVETDFQRTKVADTDETCSDGTVQRAGEADWVAIHNAGFLETTNVKTVFPNDAAHPENVSKYTNGIPLVRNFTLCEIKRLDALNPREPTKFVNYRVPTLEETLDEVTRSSNAAAKLMVEPKLIDGTESGQAIALYEAIKKYDEAHVGNPDFPNYQPFVTATPASKDRALFDTFDFRVADALADHVAAAGEDAQIAAVANSLSPVDETDPHQFDRGMAVFVDNSLVTKDRVDRLHAAGKQAIVWTVNDEDRWIELAALGVDIVVTDRSPRARQVLTGTG